MTTTRPMTIIDLAADHDERDSDSLELAGLPGRFRMHYQPELDLRDGSIGTCEALLRWWHPDYGLLRPGASLSGTRWSDQICDLEAWALRSVCIQAAAWSAAGQRVQVALNVTAGHLLHRHFRASLDLALGATALDPSLLAIDVPFHALATDPVAVVGVVASIAARGVQVIVDGVEGLGGDGFSHPSFATLASIDATAWKLPLRRGGHRNPGLHPRVGEVVRAAHRAGTLAVAKAVSDETTLEQVRELGFDRAFGHLIGRPVDARAVRPLFRPPAVARPALFDLANS